MVSSTVVPWKVRRWFHRKFDGSSMEISTAAAASGGDAHVYHSPYCLT